MANTYYDSQLTAAEIEAVLEAIDGVIVPANNGKVLAINNGKIEARSVQWGGGGGVVVQPLSVTQNGTYNPPSGVDGYAPVVVNVSGGGGDPYSSDYIVTEYNKLFEKSAAFFLARADTIYPPHTDVDIEPLEVRSIANVDPAKSYVAYAVVKALYNNNRVINFFNQNGQNLLCSYVNGNKLYAYNGSTVQISANTSDYFASAILFNVSTGIFRISNSYTTLP